MQMQQLPAFTSSEFVASHTLDAANLRAVQSSEGGPADPFVLGIADLWDAVRHLNRAFALIVKASGRVGVATASVVVEGRAGLNLGLLMPSLKRLSSPPLVAGPNLRPFDERYRRTVWEIAARLGRIEIDRLLVFRVGKDLVRLQASRAGFTFLDGCKSVPELLAALRAAVDGNLSVAYTLGDSLGHEVPPQHQLCSLFDATEVKKVPLQMAPDGWPEAVPAGIRMATITALAAAAQRLHRPDMTSDLSFSVIDTAAKTILSGTRDAKTVGLTLAPAETANG